MRIIAAALFLLAIQVEAEKCQKFNLKYKFCYEDWMTSTQVKGVQQILERASVRKNVNFIHKIERDSINFVAVVTSDELIEELSKLPYEFREDAMKESLGQVYGTALGVLAGCYGVNEIQEVSRKILAKQDSTPSLKKILNGFQINLQFNLLSEAGDLVKTYDLTSYGYKPMVLMLDPVYDKILGYRVWTDKNGNIKGDE